jgi:hypothetical protein
MGGMLGTPMKLDGLSLHVVVEEGEGDQIPALVDAAVRAPEG